MSLIIDAIENDCPESTSENPEFDALIWDGMVLLQQLAVVSLPTFADAAGFLIRRIMKKKVVFFVTDEYNPGSIKSFERDRRKSSSGTVRIKIERREQKCPKQWSKFFALEENKKEFVKFLLED